MNRSLALGLAGAAGLLGLGLLSKTRREQMRSSMRGRMQRRMHAFMDRLPDDSPPKLVASVLPRLREQNDEMLQLLREQNALLRERRQP